MSSSALVRVGGPALFVVLWSTGFVGAKYGLPYADPFPFLAVRLGLAAGLLALLAVVTRSALPRDREQYGRAAVVGVLLHAGYLGGVFSGIALGVPAGVAAVVTSLQPVLTAVLAIRVLGERLRVAQGAGLVLGVVGVVLVLAPGLLSGTGRLPIGGLGAVAVALVSGTAATLYQKRHGGEVPLLSGTAVQYAAATGLLLVAATATGQWRIEWTREFVLALAWLVVVLSIGAVLLLLVLLQRGSAASVSSLLYLVPPATALEALLLFDERLAAVSVAGVVVAAVGVALVVRPSPQPAPKSRTGASQRG